jgi:hypothetical protein
MAQVVTVEQGDRRAAVCHAHPQNGSNCTVDGVEATVQVGRQVGIGGVQLQVLVQVVAAFGHREGNHPRVAVRACRNQRRQPGVPGNDRLNGVDFLIAVLAGRGDGFQRVHTVLCGQLLQ